MISILIAVGCSSKEEQPAENEKTEEIKSSDKNEQLSEEENKPEKMTSDILIEGKYFNITLPENWKDKYTYEEIEDENGYYMGFYENTSYEDGYGGWLFSIAIPEEEEISDPSYDELGTIEKEGKEYKLIVAWPTDVQFTEETAKAYKELSTDNEKVIHSLEKK